MKMLKLTRKTQQGVVVTPKGESELSPLVIRVVDIVPGTVGLGFDGEDYEIVRSEIYNGGIDTDDHEYKPN
jgi:sRNA-binding carbon storage regulator CsrA